MVKHQQRRLLIAVDVGNDEDLMLVLASVYNQALLGRNLSLQTIPKEGGKKSWAEEKVPNSPPKTTAKGEASPTPVRMTIQDKPKTVTPAKRGPGRPKGSKNKKPSKKATVKSPKAVRAKKALKGKKGGHFQRWTGEEELQIIQMVNAGFHHKAIGKKLNRSTKAIEQRIYSMRKRGLI